MSHTVASLGAVRAPIPESGAAPRAAASPGSTTFAETLAASPEVGLSSMVLDAARDIARGQQRMDRAVARARHGQSMAPEQLLALQADVYRTTQELELASKLVDKATGAIKQTLQSQR